MKLVPIFLPDIKEVNFKAKAAEFRHCTSSSDKIVPHVVVGDEAFRLHRNTKSDSTKALFNYRLSRARRVTENEFGLLSQVFRIFYQPVNLETTTCDKLVWVACCLHNMLRGGFKENIKQPFSEYDSETSPPINNMVSIAKVGGLSYAEGFKMKQLCQNIHITNDRSAFPSFEPFGNGYSITTAKNEHAKALGRGTINLDALINGKTRSVQFTNVWYVSDVQKNL
ncbi:hypothetical protein CBL_20396 [Carabus blaptoides fortunei]